MIDQVFPANINMFYYRDIRSYRMMHTKCIVCIATPTLLQQLSALSLSHLQQIPSIAKIIIANHHIEGKLH